MITIAPELPGALQAIGRFSEAGVVVAIGHSDADAATATAGIEAGARVVTHLFNAMRSMHHREPGLAEVALTDVRVTPELILDGLHVSSLTAEIALASTAGRWIAVTDSAYVAGLPDGQYSLGDGVVDLRHGYVRAKDSGALAGSTACMADCFSRLIVHHGLPPLEAVCATASRPASVLGIQGIGSICVGARADLVLWRQGAVSAVMRRGIWIA
jgi:N-acetylglucosamine-6-phosphate deacetylase